MSASLYINIASHHTIQIWNGKNMTVDEVQAMVDDVIACNYSIARAPARSSEKVIVSVDVNIARNTLPCWCVIMLAPVIRSVIPYQWFLSHCDPSHTNAPLTPTLYSCWQPASSLTVWSLAGPVDNVRLSDLTGALETVLIMLFCALAPWSCPARPHSTIGNQL